MNARLLPPLQPREACAAALAVLVCGAPYGDAQNILAENRVDVQLKRGGEASTITLRLSARRHYEATAGCTTDAYIHALRDALGSKEEA